MFLKDISWFSDLSVKDYNQFALHEQPLKSLLDSKLRFIDLNVSNLVIHVDSLVDFERLKDYNSLAYSNEYKIPYHFENVYYIKEYDLILYINQDLDLSYFESDEFLLDLNYIYVTGIYYNPYDSKAYRNFRVFINKYLEYYDYEVPEIKPLDQFNCLSDLTVKSFKYIN